MSEGSPDETGPEAMDRENDCSEEREMVKVGKPDCQKSARRTAVEEQSLETGDSRGKARST